MELLPIGRIAYANDQGVLPNITVPHAIASWIEPLDAACDAVHDVLGTKASAVLVRGSIPRGTALAGASDLDLVIVHAGAMTEGGRTLLRSHEKTIARNFPAVTEVEFLPIPEPEFWSATRWNWMRFILAFQGLTLRGEDIVPRLPVPKLDRHAVAHDRPNAKWATDWPKHWSEARDDATRRQVCSWLMKRYVRAAFERIMFELNGYTRDLYPAAEAVARRHPDNASAIWDACWLAVFPSADHDEVQSVAVAMQASLNGNRPFEQDGTALLS